VNSPKNLVRGNRVCTYSGQGIEPAGEENCRSSRAARTLQFSTL
jgi:hypothetical protein